MAEIVAEIGMVMSQVMTILLAVPQLTSLTCCADPTPMMDDEMTCVVLTGKCNVVNVKIIAAEDRSAAAPLTGRIFMILPLTFLIIFHPPIDVPNAIAVAEEILTQRGISLSVTHND